MLSIDLLTRFIGFLFLFLRFIYWIGLSIEKIETYTPHVFVAQFAEGLLLLFFYTQFFGNNHIFAFTNNTSIQLVGLCLTVGGVLLAFIARKQLGSEWVYASAYKKQKGKQLITRGVYRFVRHPLYTGIVASYVGAELLVGSWLFVSLLFFYVPFYFQARKEEQFLLQHFGAQYKKYISHTKMFLPFLW